MPSVNAGGIFISTASGYRRLPVLAMTCSLCIERTGQNQK